MPFLAFLGRWWSYLKQLISKGKVIVKDLMPKVIELVNNIKEFDTTNPDVADFITKVIPGTWDDGLKDKAREIVPLLLVQFKASQLCLEKTNDDEMLVCVVNQLQSVLNPNIKALNWGSLTALITHALSDGKLSIEEIRSMVKYVYDN